MAKLFLIELAKMYISISIGGNFSVFAFLAQCRTLMGFFQTISQNIALIALVVVLLKDVPGET